MIQFFDTETTGLPNFKGRSNDPDQPHLVQLAIIEVDDTGAEITVHNMIIKPDGWTVTPEVTAIHGISHERAMDEGIPEKDAVAAWVLSQAACSLRVAHNESFDRRIMRIAMTRAGIARDMIEAIEARPAYCTCNAAKPIVNLPPTDRMMAAGFTSPKAPKLEECLRHFFAEDMVGAHDALIDVRACARVYWHLRSLSAAS